MTPILVVVLLWKMFQVLKKKFFLEKKNLCSLFAQIFKSLK